MSHVLYICPDADCGNVLTGAQVEAVTVPFLNAIVTDGTILCGAPKHGMEHPAMTRVEVDA